MDSKPTRGRILVISNGHGEDSIGAEIVRRFPPGASVDAYPMVGDGSAYDGLCPIVGPRNFIPSQGSRVPRGTIWRDLWPILKSIPCTLRFLRDARQKYRKVLLLGDLSGLYLALPGGLPVAVYVDVFKVGQAHAYNRFERWLIKRTARRVFCRDDILARQLRDAGVDAVSVGNVMMDTVPAAAYDAQARRAHPLAIALLPGSRSATPQAFALQSAAVEKIASSHPADIFVAVAEGVDLEQLAAAAGLQWHPPQSGQPADLGRLEGRGLVFHLARGALTTLIEVADVVLSQAGTATQQALGLGKPVITFDTPANRRKRMDDEQALMGEARILTEKSADAVAAALSGLLQDQSERTRLGRIGRARLGNSGTADAVLAELMS